MKTQYIDTIAAGDDIRDLFVLSEKNIAQKKDGNRYLTIVLSDRTGSLKGVVWDRVDTLGTAVQIGEVIRVQGMVSEYRGSLQMVVKTMEPVSQTDVDPTDFMPATGHNIDAMFDRLVKISQAVGTDHLRMLLMAFWQDDDLVRRFKRAPAAKKMHHAYIGGLLEHTLSMAVLVERIAGHYTGIDMDLLTVGVMLHDIGKVREFDYHLGIDYSDEGRLLSHIVIGLEMIEEKLQGIQGFPPEQAFLLKHLIVSHHGTRDFGSPEPPKTLEAVMLNYIDEIDSKVNGIRDFMESENSTETWTAYHRIFGRYFYRGKTSN
jgi:3'-5' exoribonuclease